MPKWLDFCLFCGIIEVMKNRQGWIWLALGTILTTFVVWLPFLAHSHSVFGIPLPQTGLLSLVANFDGPYYAVVARSFYDLSVIRTTFSFPLPLEYYAAHFPLFPILVRLVAPFLGYGYGMLVATVTGSVLAVVALFELLKEEKVKHPLGVASVFLILPARWLVVRSIGSPEPWFLFFIVTSLLYFRRENYWLAGILGALATLTKSPGILLFAAYALYLTRLRVSAGNFSRKTLPLLIIPFSLVGLFLFFQLRMGDFMAYFHSGDNIHLQLLPFQVFNSQQPWVGTFWLEDIIYIYLLGGLAVVELVKQKRGVLAWFGGVFLATLLFVSHRDLARYSLPLVPLAIVAFAPYLARKEVRLLLLLLWIPIYFYTINFITNNTLAIADWSAILAR